jgi:hypothetical protein
MIHRGTRSGKTRPEPSCQFPEKGHVARQQRATYAQKENPLQNGKKESDDTQYEKGDSQPCSQQTIHISSSEKDDSIRQAFVLSPMPNLFVKAGLRRIKAEPHLSGSISFLVTR